VTKLPADIIKTYGVQIQKLLNAYNQGAQLKVDGFVGPVTVSQAAAELRK
jgi:peptidoglycan hydrolase-like protein with peptidoglycan-binding domain